MRSFLDQCCQTNNWHGLATEPVLYLHVFNYVNLHRHPQLTKYCPSLTSTSGQHQQLHNVAFAVVGVQVLACNVAKKYLQWCTRFGLGNHSRAVEAYIRRIIHDCVDANQRPRWVRSAQIQGGCSATAVHDIGLSMVCFKVDPRVGQPNRHEVAVGHLMYSWVVSGLFLFSVKTSSGCCSVTCTTTLWGLRCRKVLRLVVQSQLIRLIHSVLRAVKLQYMKRSDKDRFSAVHNESCVTWSNQWCASSTSTTNVPQWWTDNLQQACITLNWAGPPVPEKKT